MADDDVKYEFSHVRSIRGREASTITKWQNDGWELVSQSPGKVLRTEMTFRRVKPDTFLARSLAVLSGLSPKSRRLLLASFGGLILIAFVGIVAAVQSGGDEPTSPPTGAVASKETTEEAPETPSEEATPTEQPSEQPTAEPTPIQESAPSQTAHASPVTDAEVVNAFQTYIDERAAADVVIAKAVTDVSFSDRVLRVTFDPAAVGMDQSTFDSVNPYNNPYDPAESLADFVSAPVAFNDKLGKRLRSAIDRIDTVNAAGKPLGTRTMAEIIKLNGLNE
jgi:hypothetical protein